MSFHYNHVALAGNLTRDPELRATSTTPVCNFALAINRRWRNANGENQDDTTFVDCECWGRTAELVAQYLTKGSPVLLDGRLKFDSWQDQSGQRTSRIKVVASNVRFLPDQRSSKSSQPQPAGHNPSASTPSTGIDEAPF